MKRESGKSKSQRPKKPARGKPVRKSLKSERVQGSKPKKAKPSKKKTPQTTLSQEKGE